VIFRVLDKHPVDAWFLASFIFFLIGNIGWIFVAKKIYNNQIIQLSFVWVVSTFPTFIILVERAPQILAFSWISWLFYLTIISIENAKQNKTNYSLAILSILLPLLMLTSWYPAFFYLVTISVAATFYFISNINKLGTYLKKHRVKILSRKNLIFILSTSISILLLMIWLYIYLPLLGETSRSWTETIYYSSYLGQVLNQQYLNNGWYFIFIKNSQYTPFQQSNVALPALTIILALIFLILSFQQKNQLISKYRNYMVLPTTLIFLVFLRLTEEFSLYRVFWETIPGLQSIRFPYRYIIVLGFALTVFIFFQFDNLIAKWQNIAFKRGALVALILLLAFDSFKPPYAIWSKQDYLSEELEQQVNQIRKHCEYFILDKPGGWWDDQISGISLSVLSGVPTANGYSGGFPNGYPTKDWNYDGDISGILDWAEFGTSNKDACLVSTSHKLIKSNPQEPQIFFHSGFSPEESNAKGAIWRWAESSKGYILLNIPQGFDAFRFSFEAKTPECVEGNKLKVTQLPDKELLSSTISNKAQSYDLQLFNNHSGVNKLMFEVDNMSCKFLGDPRDLYFEIKNYKID
jgi:hypothetical protein